MPTRKWAKNIRIKHGGLGGWHESQPARTRHEHLRAKIREDGAGEISRRLNFLANVADRRNNRRLHEIARTDQRWVERNFERASVMRE